MATPTMALITCWARIGDGARPVISSRSFMEKAMALPETDPMRTPNSTSAVTYTAGLSPSECRCSSSITEIRRPQAPPPTPLKMATRPGMAVSVRTLRATGTATAVRDGDERQHQFFPGVLQQGEGHGDGQDGGGGTPGSWLPWPGVFASPSP